MHEMRCQHRGARPWLKRRRLSDAHEPQVICGQYAYVRETEQLSSRPRLLEKEAARAAKSLHSANGREIRRSAKLAEDGAFMGLLPAAGRPDEPVTEVRASSEVEHVTTY